LARLVAGPPSRCQRARDQALRALRAPRRFAPASRVLLSPGPLVAALPVHRLHHASFDDSPGVRAELAQLTANTSWRPEDRLGAISRRP